MPTLFMRMENGEPASEPLSVESLFTNVSWKRGMTYAEKREYAARAGVYPVLNNRPQGEVPFGQRVATVGYQWNPNSEVFTRTWRQVPLPLENVRRRALSRITKNREVSAYADLLYEGAYYQVDKQSIQCILGALEQARLFGLPAGFTWRDRNNDDHILTEVKLRELGAAAFTQANDAYKRAHRQKDAARAAVNVQELAAALELS